MGLTKTDDEWSAALEAALTAARRDDLVHGTNAAYVHGCVCKECRAHQRIRMARVSEIARERVSAPVSAGWCAVTQPGPRRPVEFRLR